MWDRGEEYEKDKKYNCYICKRRADERKKSTYWRMALSENGRERAVDGLNVKNKQMS